MWLPAKPGFARFFDDRVGVVVVDGLEVFRLHAVPFNVGLAIGARGDVAHEVLHEHGVLVGALGDSFFVGPLEQGVELGTRAALDELDEVFDPDRLMESDGIGDLPALVVRAVFADRLFYPRQYHY